MCTVQNTQQRKRENDDERNGFALFTISNYSKRTVLSTIKIAIQFERP